MAVADKAKYYIICMIHRIYHSSIDSSELAVGISEAIALKPYQDKTGGKYRAIKPS
jgi:hypothetical protein